MGNEFRCIGCIHIYRTFNFRAYPNCWFSLCMAKRSIGMVLAPEYSDNKNQKGKTNNVDKVMNFRIKFDMITLSNRNFVI